MTDTDKPSIDISINRLRLSGCYNVGDINPQNNYSRWDMSGLTNEGVPFLAESKRKKSKEENNEVPHDKYWDIMCDKAKYDEFLKLKEEGKYQTCLVINFFPDGYIGIANPKYGYNVEEKWVDKTTEFGDKGKQLEEVITMKHPNNINTSDYKKFVSKYKKEPQFNEKVLYMQLNEDEMVALGYAV